MSSSSIYLSGLKVTLAIGLMSAGFTPRPGCNDSFVRSFLLLKKSPEGSLMLMSPVVGYQQQPLT